MKRTVVDLADHRELIYFDADETADRSAVDERELEPASHGGELRRDRARDEWVIVAAHRQSRPFQPPTNDCPLCPSRPGHLTEVPAADYDVVVFQNRFPALGAEPPTDPVDPDAVSRPAVGRCEVVCFTDEHNSSFADLDVDRAGLVVEAWADRTAALSALPGVEQVFCFENRGREVGVTLDHPHGQIYAYPFVTPRTAQMLAAARGHRERTGRNLFDDLVAAELEAGDRVVATNEHWVAFVPFAAHWPYEVHLYPRRRVPGLLELGPAERSAFAALYLDVLGRFDGLFDDRTPYISAIHQAPVRDGRDELALHVELYSVRRSANRLKYLAASESAMDAFANDVSPEYAARRLREAGDKRRADREPRRGAAAS